jgi:hypothetical protein
MPNKGRQTGTMEERMLVFIQQVEEAATDPAERWAMLKGMVVGRKVLSRRIADSHTKYLEKKRAADIAAGQEVR